MFHLSCGEGWVITFPLHCVFRDFTGGRLIAFYKLFCIN
jgi:hypothetical protein